MPDMQEIPKPQLLDPNRVDRDDREDMTAEDHRSQAQLLSKALEESCGYADQLWNQLNAVRGYLLESLPPDPRLPGPHTVTCASPTGPDDEDGWQQWISAFSTTTSTLCGPHGDSGFGLTTARGEAQRRRTAREMLMHAEHPDTAVPVTGSPAVTRSTPTQHSAAAHAEAAAKPASGLPPALRTAGAAVVGVLALRGLLPRGRRNDRPQS